MFPWYGGRGIKFKLTSLEVRALWARDGGKNLKRPSLDRRDPNGNYEFNNCEFIEFELNLARANAARAARITPQIYEPPRGPEPVPDFT